MSERQPIDELFRRTLQDAEVTPPTAVWEGIVRERSKRRSGYWGWLVATLVVMGGAAAVWFSVSRTPNATVNAGGSSSVASSPTLVAEVGTAAADDTTAAITGRSIANSQELPADEAREMSLPAGAGNAAASRQPAPGDPLNGANRNAATGAGKGDINGVGSGRAPALAVVAPGALNPRTKADPRASAHHLDRLVPLIPVATTMPVKQDGLRTKEKPAPYVLPNADWWVALEVGRFDERRTWYGTDEQLVNGLNDTEVRHYTWSIGALVGRSWRNGLGVSLGTAYEASEQSFRFAGPATVQNGAQYFPYLVTLDTQVFVSNVDTVPTYTTQQKQTNATNRFSVVHFSAEGYWHVTHRRWTFGPRLGLGTEFMTMRNGYTLDGASDTALVAVALSASDYDARYATTLTGLFGADVGFALNEHWGVWATPSYMRGLSTWGNGDAPHMLPERLGLRLRVSYTFTKIP
jgi:hypothetical protein